MTSYLKALDELADEKKKKDKFVIKEYSQRFWRKAEVYKNGKKIADINKFYDVTTDWIIIYDEIGGTGTGYEKGDILEKIFIGDAEFSKEYADDSIQ